MARLEQLIAQHAELPAAAVETLAQLVSEWTLLADLSFSDLLLWVPKWHDRGYVCVAQIRPVTAPTTIDSDLVGSFQSDRRLTAVDQATSQLQIIEAGTITAIPIIQSGTVIAVIERHRGERQEGALTTAYLSAAKKLFAMAKAGQFPPAVNAATISSLPRVGDGVLLLNSDGIVEFASPNATSAFRRLGLATNLIGTELGAVSVSLVKQVGVINEAINLIASGTIAGATEIENNLASITLRSYPFVLQNRNDGALVLVRDVTELRRRERALLTKEAALREAHHRVKNNLQTVAALLRMQARRSSTEAKRALAEAERRIEVIALVHETLTLAPAENVQFNDVADRLIALSQQLATTPPKIQRIGDFGTYSAEQAVPLAAALSELLQNAIEHGDNSEEIRIEADLAGKNFKVINRAKTKGAHAEGLGLSIVRSLVEGELAGSVTIDSSAGEFQVQISLPK
ncbi:MAG: sensor histidine kinase [Candidatus Nanopelagicales bacterium]